MFPRLGSSSDANAFRCDADTTGLTLKPGTLEKIGAPSKNIGRYSNQDVLDRRFQLGSCTHTYIYIYTYIYTHIHVLMYLYMHNINVSRISSIFFAHGLEGAVLVRDQSHFWDFGLIIIVIVLVTVVVIVSDNLLVTC